ncbi:phage regulatory CII family protein [Chitinasiproducens palmae]|uniref:Phage regulatory protein CII (CP76) n=1 Tax=Chitinasiproducens palmae TaxID=1770053 RepID=A0A1H2PPQ7_9BURK|nr:phage regulatory CII family protein [Chitinasiproducens palmae]SDV47930.1 Phage regulatory protein CII (CP76) [Chitinasiproducens palmae]
MNIADATHAMVHDYAGGSESLAPRIGMSPAVLRNKVNPNNATHHLTVAELDRLIGVTGDVRPLRALVHQHGYVMIPVSADGCAADLDVVEHLAVLMVRQGAVGKSVYETLADGRVEQHEVDHVKRNALAVSEALQHLVAALQGMSETRPD